MLWSLSLNIYLFKVAIEALEMVRNMLKVNNKDTKTTSYKNDVNDVVLVSLLLTLNIFHILS